MIWGAESAVHKLYDADAVLSKTCIVDSELSPQPETPLGQLFEPSKHDTGQQAKPVKSVS